jgi:hypothetical protein
MKFIEIRRFDAKSFDQNPLGLGADDGRPSATVDRHVQWLMRLDGTPGDVWEFQLRILADEEVHRSSGHPPTDSSGNQTPTLSARLGHAFNEIDRIGGSLKGDGTE